MSFPIYICIFHLFYFIFLFFRKKAMMMQIAFMPKLFNMEKFIPSWRVSEIYIYINSERNALVLAQSIQFQRLSIYFSSNNFMLIGLNGGNHKAQFVDEFGFYWHFYRLGASADKSYGINIREYFFFLYFILILFHLLKFIR